jgi:hypothetical protein
MNKTEIIILSNLNSDVDYNYLKKILFISKEISPVYDGLKFVIK